jgi:Fe-S-cluster containining protein
VFAVTLVEAVQWSLAVEALPPAVRDMVRQRAEALLDFQRRVFAEVGGPPDVPGERDEALFSARISRVNQSHPACPMLIDDLCSVYDARPMLCRAYGFPVDAYAVESRDTLVFRSLCVLYEGTQLVDYVRAKDLKAQLNELSVRLAGGRDHGRFTSSEAILATVHGGH